jgi:hypothetical protein
MGATDDAISELREAESLDGRFREIVAPRERAVAADDYGDRWPLTVPGGTIRYEPAGRAIFRDLDGNEYQLNGMAQTAGYAPIDPIWKVREVIPGREGEAPVILRVNIGPLIDDALALKDEEPSQ